VYAAIAAVALPFGAVGCQKEAEDAKPTTAQEPASTPAEAAESTPSQTPAPAPDATVLFEVTGSGTAITIDTDPATDRVYDAPLPWQRTVSVGPDVQLLQVIAVGGDDAGCRITLDGQVVTEQPAGSAHCTYTRP
jgi:Mycobacterium membrane protein